MSLTSESLGIFKNQVGFDPLVFNLNFLSLSNIYIYIYIYFPFFLRVSLYPRLTGLEVSSNFTILI